MVNTRATADMIVKDNLLVSPGIRNSLSMMLVGGLLVDSSYILKGHGPVIAYKRLMRTPKHVFLSTGFKKEYPGAVQVIQKAVASQGTPKRWHLLSITRLWDPNLVICDSNDSSIQTLKLSHWRAVFFKFWATKEKRMVKSYAKSTFLCFVGVDEFKNDEEATMMMWFQFSTNSKLSLKSFCFLTQVAKLKKEKFVVVTGRTMVQALQQLDPSRTIRGIGTYWAYRPAHWNSTWGKITCAACLFLCFWVWHLWIFQWWWLHWRWKK